MEPRTASRGSDPVPSGGLTALGSDHIRNEPGPAVTSRHVVGPDLRVTSSGPLSASYLVPRLISDVVAVAVGLVVYGSLTGNFGLRQVLLAVSFIPVAAVMDVTHVRREWNAVEELVIAVKTAVVSLLIIAGAGFLAGIVLSRILFCSIGASMLLVRPIMAIGAERIWSPLPRGGTMLTVLDNHEHEALLAATREEPQARHHLERLTVPPTGSGPDGRWAKADVDQLVAAAQSAHPSKVVVGDRMAGELGVLMALDRLNEDGIPIRSFTRAFEEEFGRVPLGTLGTSWFLFDIGPLHRRAYRVGRRLADLVAGAAAALLLLVLFPLLYVAVKMESRGPFIYRQRRVGQRNHVFTLFKIRTMRTGAEVLGPRFATPGDPRVTRVGRLLRRCRIDELPQAVNLIRGDMSLIGPRPERPEWVAHFREAIPFYDKRHMTKPGLTGWAQVHEGYSASVEDAARKLERDLYYLRYQSLGIDLRILLATAGEVLRLTGQ